MLFLLYHDIIFDGACSGFEASSATKYKISETTFKCHLDMVSNSSFEFWDGGQPVNENSICFTFDDGGISNLQTAALLDRYNTKGIFFIVTGLIGRDGFLNADQICELKHNGHWVGSHSATHPDRMAFLPQHELYREWSNSRSDLAKIVGDSVHICSVPGGSVSKDVVLQADLAGYGLLFNSMPRREKVFDLIHGESKLRSIGRVSITAEWTEQKFRRLLSSVDRSIVVMKVIYVIKHTLIHQNRFFSWIFTSLRRCRKRLY